MTKVREEIEYNKNWILPGKTLSNREFIAEIKKAEKGPFHSVQKSMENFELWLTTREKK